MKRFALIGLFVTIVAIGAGLFVGCENERTGGLGDVPLSIDPVESTLRGEDTTVVLEAMNGRPPYTWVASDDTLGTLTGSGAIVTYTRGTKNGDNVVEVTDDHAWVARATIHQEDWDELTVEPQNASVSTNGGTRVFTAAGGSGTYAWSIQSGDGTLSDLTGATTVYTAGNDNDNTIIELSDGDTKAYATETKTN